MAINGRADRIDIADQLLAVFDIIIPDDTHLAAFLNILSAAGELLRVAPLLPAKA